LRGANQAERGINLHDHHHDTKTYAYVWNTVDYLKKSSLENYKFLKVIQNILNKNGGNSDKSSPHPDNWDHRDNIAGQSLPEDAG
jgi:hypothetical protein